MAPITVRRGEWRLGSADTSRSDTHFPTSPRRCRHWLEPASRPSAPPPTWFGRTGS